MMLLLPSLRSACTSAAKLVPVSLTRPTASVAPGPTVELLTVGIPGTPGVVVLPPTAPPLNANAAKSTMLVPAPGKLMTPAGTVELALSEQQPLHAEIGTLVHVDFDDDGFNVDLRAADIELVDDRHQRLHDLGRRRNDQRVGGDVRPNGDTGIDIGGAALRPLDRRLNRWPALCLGRGGGLAFELFGDLFGVRIAQIAYLGIPARR